MLYEIATLVIIVVLTALAFRKNALIYLSLSFLIIYFLEIFILYSQGALGVERYFELFSCKSTVLDIGIFTGIYLHSLNPGHIFFNILIFFLAGQPFERKVGSRRFTLIFIISGVLANVGYSLFLRFSGIQSFLVGASGAIFGIMGAFLILYPDEEITMFLGPVLMPRVKVKYAVLAFMAVEFAFSFLWVNDNVAHGAHVIGAVTGAVLGHLLRSRGASKIPGGKVNYDLLQSLADTDELRNILARIRAEDHELIQNSWIEEFFRKKFGDAKWDGKTIISGGKRYRIRR